MGRNNKDYHKTLHQQAYDRLNSMIAFGESKRAALVKGETEGKIYSYATYKTYKKHINYFLRWIKETHPECKNLKAAKQYVKNWLTLRSEQVDDKGNHLSAYTIHTESAALSKLFGIPKDSPDRFVPPKRERKSIKRSRLAVDNDKHFSKSNNDELIRFCCGTGCRRNVLEKLTGDDLWNRDRIHKEIVAIKSQRFKNEEESKRLAVLLDAVTTFPEENWFILHKKDKGGKYRLAPVIGPDKELIITRMKMTPKDKRVWLHVNSHADIHSYRSIYATILYKQYARDISSIPYDRINQGSGKLYQSGVYVCRSDEKGKKLDRKAMFMCSKALGHNRISIVAGNYLRGI